MAQNRGRPTVKKSGFVSFVAGFVFTVLFGVTVALVWGLAYSFFILRNPFDLLSIFFGVLFVIAVPIFVGRMWRHKASRYWDGVILGLAILFVMYLLLRGFSQIGSNPV